MRISDWSSDVCSSDLLVAIALVYADIERANLIAALRGSKFCISANSAGDCDCLHVYAAFFFLWRASIASSKRDCGMVFRLVVPMNLQNACRSAPTSSAVFWRSEEHTSELQSLMRISYAVFCLKKKNSI